MFVLMSDAATAHSAQDLDMVSAMVGCAYELGMAAGAMAKACKDHKAFLAASAEFRQCFFAVRMGIRLKLSLRAGPKPAAVERAEAESVEREAADRPERDPPERDRDREPVSLPQFLKSLGVVASNAERRKEQLPHEVATQTLPRLHALLAGVNNRRAPDVAAPQPAARSAGIAILERPQAPAPIRSRLLGSAAAPLRGPPRRSSA
jgi:hypothetical protein